MKWIILRKLGISLITLFIATVVVFVGVQALPGDPAQAMTAEVNDPEVAEAIRARYGLDRPLPVQYFMWLGNALQGDLGISIQSGLSVSAVLGDRIMVTLQLAALSLAIAMAIGIPLGIIAAIRKNTIIDHLASTTSLIGLSIPNFWLGMLLILAFGIQLGWLPASGYVPFAESPTENLARMLMPALALGTGLAAVIMRQMRSAMLDSMEADYVRTARAKGLSEWVVVGVHALRNSLTTVITVIGLQLGMLISGVVITETIFVIPGLGKYTLDSLYSRDYVGLQGVVLLTATSYIVVNLLVDLAYAVLNPRTRTSGTV